MIRKYLSCPGLLFAVTLLLTACGNGEGDSPGGEPAAGTASASADAASGETLEEAAGETGAVVLMYHRFGEDRYPSTSIRMEQFEAHVGYLQEADFNIWPLERVVKYLREGKAMPDRTVAITIDDAYRSIYENAYPVFREKGWPYTVFVNTDGPDSGQQAYMSWEQMRAMSEDSRVSFANHSASHDYLVARREGEDQAAWASRVRADIEKAATRLRNELDASVVLDSPPVHAYPYGEYDVELKSILDDMGFVAFGQHSGPVGHYSDLLALPRFAMAEAYGAPDDFRQRVNTRPLPIEDVSPSDPTAIDRQDPPAMTLRFAETDIPLKRLQCFAAGSPAEVRWEESGAMEATVQAESPLGEGRSRYNCTLPTEEGRYYWFSFQWVKGRAGGE